MAYLIVMFGLNSILPAWTGAENSVLELLQLCFLAGGFCYSFHMLSRRLLDWGGSQKALWSASSLYFFILGMREISWGRTLLLHADGSFYRYSEMGLYGQLVHPLVGVLIVILLFLLWRSRFWCWLLQVKLSASDFLLLLLFIFFCWVAEKGNWAYFHGAVAEELAENGAYFMMVYLIYEMVQQAKQLRQKK